MTFGFVHGFELVDEFWEAPDMNGIPISGTYIILITRIVAAAALLSVIVYLVPLYHKRVAIVVASLVSAAALGFLGFILIQTMSADLQISPDGWYRQILDMLSIILGAILGTWMAYRNQKRRARAQHITPPSGRGIDAAVE